MIILYSRFVSSSGCCSLCGLPIDNGESGCVVINKLYHNRCFTCQKCGRYTHV